jgi:hypothetical protein
MCVRIEAVFGAVRFSVAWYRHRSMLPRSVIPVQPTTADTTKWCRLLRTPQNGAIYCRHHKMVPSTADTTNGAFVSNVMVFLIVGKLWTIRVGVWDDKRFNVKQRWNDILKGVGGGRTLSTRKKTSPTANLSTTYDPWRPRVESGSSRWETDTYLPELWYGLFPKH